MQQMLIVLLGLGRLSALMVALMPAWLAGCPFLQHQHVSKLCQAGLSCQIRSVVCAFCLQSDIHSNNITVLESLVFSARLRFTSEVKRNIVYAFVQEVCLLLFLAAPSVMHAAECMWQWFRMLRLVSRHLPIAPPLLQCEHACSWRFCWCVAVAECSRVSAGTCQISRESPFNPK